MPFGAECSEEGGVRFRLWAPKAEKVDLCLQGDKPLRFRMSRKNEAWFEVITDAARPGDLYRYQIGDEVEVPDPASRFQPQDVHGPSEIIDPSFDWADQSWHGRPWEEAVIYELHVGTFTPEGTFGGVEKKLDYLAGVGVTAIELMPLSDFSGRRNWGYDGVLPYAPDSSYGRPEDLKRLIQSAHAKGLMVFLDVVYNHFGPDGNYLNAYAPEFFTSRHRTPWGEAINFDGPQNRTVRDFFMHNALYWLEEYNFDGLRFDAVHTIMDDSNPDILVELAEKAHETLGTRRHIHLILENGDNEAHYLRTAKDADRASWYTAQWNDDTHHALHVLLTGEKDGYYSDYTDDPISQLGRCLAEGFAFQGDYSKYHGATRGEASAQLSPLRFVNFVQNHDQIGNRAFGERMVYLTNEDRLKAAMSILLLSPSPPLLFMGEEFGATTPFLFFCDYTGDLAAAVTTGRRGEFASFEKFSSQELLSQIPDPNSVKTFELSKLDWQSANEKTHQNWLNFYRDLLLIRRNQIVPHLKGAKGSSAKFLVNGKKVLNVSWKLRGERVLTLIANLRDETAGFVPRPGGDLIYGDVSIGSGSEIELSSWQVAWFLQP